MDGDDIGPLLITLMERAHCHILPPLVERPDESLAEAIKAMREAARTTKIGKLSLDKILWTRIAPYWNGEIANRLNAAFRSDAQSYLLLVATAVTSKALYFKSASPLIVTQSISGQHISKGPFIALLRCQIDAAGKIQAINGHAQAIASGACCFPMLSNHDRDVFHLLRAIQRNLDLYGIDLSISRPIAAGGGFIAHQLNISIFSRTRRCAVSASPRRTRRRL